MKTTKSIDSFDYLPQSSSLETAIALKPNNKKQKQPFIT